MLILISQNRDIFCYNIGGKLRSSAGGGEGVLSFAPFLFAYFLQVVSGKAL